MEWRLIRTHYVTHYTNARLTQEAIATRGGLASQNAISKLLVNSHRGPSVETFVRAVIGLGLDLSSFFAELESGVQPGHNNPTAPSTTPSILDRLTHLEAAIVAIEARLYQPQPPQRIPDATLAAPDSNQTTVDLQRVAEVVHATAARIAADLEHLNQQVAILDRRHGGLLR